jgi:hypothetical protein
MDGNYCPHALVTNNDVHALDPRFLLPAFCLQALALDEEVPDLAELEDDTEPDVMGISKHRATLVSILVKGLDV